ncbi:hypothetical protein HZH68_007886 [Vespula germanica]|uniref:Uncharacterized protein n=1 Tax=Vespula germanica TaxID=30212 RepID=A0A834K2Q9_VESGE|nr:hypothetical protein HZH68_007886 [Vespula germanica]
MSQEDANTMKVKVSWLARKHRGSSKNIAWLLARGETPYLRIDLEFSRHGVTNFCRLYESDKGLVSCRNERLNLISSMYTHTVRNFIAVDSPSSQLLAFPNNNVEKRWFARSGVSPEKY